MLDAPQWIEIGASIVTVGAVVIWSLIDGREDRDLLLIWVGATAVTLVVLDIAPMGIIFSVGVAFGCSAIENRLARYAALAVSAGATALLMTRGIDSRLIAGALATTAVLGLALWHLDRVYGHIVMLILLGGTAVGIYINVPDTEQIAVLATALPLLAASMIMFSSLRRRTVAGHTLALLAAFVMASGAVGARGRVDSFIGVAGAIGVLLAEPVARIVRRRSRAYPSVLVVLHAAVVIIASGIAGVYGSWSAEPAIAAALGAAVLLLIVLPRRPLPLDPPESVPLTDG